MALNDWKRYDSQDEIGSIDPDVHEYMTDHFTSHDNYANPQDQIFDGGKIGVETVSYVGERISLLISDDLPEDTADQDPEISQRLEFFREALTQLNWDVRLLLEDEKQIAIAMKLLETKQLLAEFAEVNLAMMKIQSRLKKNLDRNSNQQDNN